MFARTANDGGDDPYNFDIVDGYGGGGSKKSKKSKLGGKASLNKTVGASPSTSSLIPQVGTQANVVQCCYGRVRFLSRVGRWLLV